MPGFDDEYPYRQTSRSGSRRPSPSRSARRATSPTRSSRGRSSPTRSSRRSSPRRSRTRQSQSPRRPSPRRQGRTYNPPAMKGRMRSPPEQALIKDHASYDTSVLTPPEKVYLSKSPDGGSVTSHLTFETESHIGASHVSDSRPPSTSYRLAASEKHFVKSPSPRHREKLSKWYEQRFPILSKSDSQLDGTVASESGEEEEHGSRALNDALLSEDDDYLKTKQSIAVMSIGLTAAQLLILMLQLAMCGVASMDINLMVGPFPDAFSEWGGKNAYLMLYNNEWWRLVTPAFLHVGVLHLLANAFCQLESVALFEREWGSFRWLVVYLISSVGCNAFSSYFDPNTISVGSSGALMGLYAAKLAQVGTQSFFDVARVEDHAIRLDQLSSVLCGMTVISLLSCFTYIDWSGHMGGLLTGFLSGMVLFSCPIRSCCTWFLWTTIGLLGLVASLASILYFFITTVEPEEDIGDSCEYFRSLFPEDYECGCMWF